MAITERMEDDDLRALPVTVDVETAGKAFGMGRTKSNDLARAGQFPVPVLTLGSRRVVTKAALLGALGWEWDDAAGWHPTASATKASAA
jgi:hypothetical protein